MRNVNEESLTYLMATIGKAVGLVLQKDKIIVGLFLFNSAIHV